MRELWADGEDAVYQDPRYPERITLVQQRWDSTVELLIAGCAGMGYREEEIEQALQEATAR
jgi:hypothetical protein